MDRIVEQWARERPDLDASPMRVIGRLHRLADVLDRSCGRCSPRQGLGDGDFDVLVSLRRPARRTS